MIIDQQDLVKQEILQLCYLAAASTNSISKYAEYQDELRKKKLN